VTVPAPMESIFRPAFVLMAGRALGFVATFAIPVVLARIFDQNEFGTYKQLFLIFSTLYCIAQLGMAESLFYFLPAAPRLGGRYVYTAMLAMGMAGSVCLAFLWGAQTSIARWFNNGALAGYLPLIGFYLLFTLVAAVLEIVMTARNRHVHASVAYAATDLLRAVLFIGTVLWLGQIEALLFAAIAISLLRLGAAIAYLYREYDGDLAPDTGLARAHLAYAAPFAIYVLLDVVQLNLHLYVVSYRFDAATFAIYAVGCLSIPLVDFLTSSAGNVMMVRMRERLLSGANDSVLAIWRDTTRKLVLVLAPLVGGLLVVAHELIVVLFTGSYERSVPVFMVWAVMTLFSALMTDSMLRVYAQIRFLMWLSVVKLAMTAATIGWLVDAFGLPGAVLAVLLTTMIAKGLALIRIRMAMQCRVAEFLPWGDLAKIIVIAAIAAPPALAMKSLLAIPDLPLLLLTGSVYVATCLTLLWRYGLLSGEEKIAFIRWARKPISGVWRRLRV